MSTRQGLLCTSGPETEQAGFGTAEDEGMLFHGHCFWLHKLTLLLQRGKEGSRAGSKKHEEHGKRQQGKCEAGAEEAATARAVGAKVSVRGCGPQRRRQNG